MIWEFLGWCLFVAIACAGLVYCGYILFDGVKKEWED